MCPPPARHQPLQRRLDQVLGANVVLRYRALDRQSFKLCDFRGATLRGASLRGTSFAGCDLREVDFRDTDLTYATFSYVRTHDPAYGRTDVTGAVWDGAKLTGVTAERGSIITYIAASTRAGGGFPIPF